MTMLFLYYFIIFVGDAEKCKQNLKILFFTDDSNWLCCNEFTLADVSLGILLHRLRQLGLEKHFWGNKQKPFLSKYYERITKQKSFQAAIPSRTAITKAAWTKLPYGYKICAIVMPTLVIGIIIYKI